MGKHREAVVNVVKCADVGDLPPDYSKLLPKGVPPSETPSAGSAPAGTTWYFPIRLPATNPTGVFIPQDFTYPDWVDVILYFHGNKTDKFGQHPNTNINYYWGGKYNDDAGAIIRLREDLNTSRMDALLVAPTMGPAPGHQLEDNADLGIFREPGGGDCFLDHVMQWLGKYDTHYASRKIIPKVGHVVLAGHSGGGSAILLQMSSMKANICEVWCFDVVYWRPMDWIIFARTNPNTPITFFHAIQSTDSYNALKKLKKDTEKKFKVEVKNMQFVEAGKFHFRALTDNFLKQLQNSNCLSSIRHWYDSPVGEE